MGKIKLGYDARMIQHSGIGIRIFHILKYLIRENQGRFHIHLFGSPEKLSVFKDTPDVTIVPYHTPIYSFREFFGHPMMRKMDVLDIPHFNSPWLFLSKTVVTVHDLTPYILKQFFPSVAKRVYLNFVFQILKKASAIVGVSNHTLQDLTQEFQFPRTKLHLIYNGLDRETFYPRSEKEISQFKQKYNLPDKFLLAVGIGKEHKNLNFVVQNLKKAWQEGQWKLPLVIAGSSGKIPEFLKKDIIGIEKFIIPMKYIDYSELPLLYQSASVLVYPSLYEGFGFPLIEAQAQNTPVFSSNVSVMPEILKDSAMYFHPLDDPEFINKLNTIYDNNDVRNTLIKKGKDNIERFRWEESAKKTCELYLKVYAKKR